MSRDWFGLFLNGGRASSQADLPGYAEGASLAAFAAFTT